MIYSNYIMDIPAIQGCARREEKSTRSTSLDHPSLPDVTILSINFFSIIETIVKFTNNMTVNIAFNPYSY